MTKKDAILEMFSGKKIVGDKFREPLKFIYFDGELFKRDNYELIDINNLSSWSFKIYEEPKKTKIVFEYLVKCVHPNAWATCGYLYTEEEALANFSSPYIKTGRQFEVELC